MSEADQPRSLPVSSVAEEGQAAIVEARPHANPMTLGVESDQWHQNQIQALRGHNLTVSRSGLEDVEAIAPKSRLGVDAHKPEPARGVRAQHRQIPTAMPSKSLADGRWIELTRNGKIERDAPCRVCQAAAEEPLTDGLRVLALLALTQGAARAAQASSKQGVGHDELAMAKERHLPPVPVQSFVLEPVGSSGDAASSFRLSARGGHAQRPDSWRPQGTN